MTKKQAKKQLEDAQREMVEAMRRGDQRAVDKASDKAMEAFAVMVNSKAAASSEVPAKPINKSVAGRYCK